MNPNQQQGPDPSGPILAIITIAAAALAGLYLGAQLAALAVHRQLIQDVTLDSVIHFARHLPQHWDNPADAWPPDIGAASLTGPVPFWTATVIVWLSMIVIAFKVTVLIGGDRKVGQRRETRFGAPAWSREATRSDLATLIVKGPTPERTIFGTSHGKLLATVSSPKHPGARNPQRTQPRPAKERSVRTTKRVGYPGRGILFLGAASRRPVAATHVQMPRPVRSVLAFASSRCV